MNSLVKTEDTQGFDESTNVLHVRLDDGRSFHIPKHILPYFDDKHNLPHDAEFIMISNLPRPLEVSIDDEKLVVYFDSGRTVTVPTRWYPRLWLATEEQRVHVEFTDSSLHWPDLDEDILITDLLLGGPSAESSGSVQRWMKKQNALE